MHVAYSGGAVYVVFAGPLPESFFFIVAAIEDAFADFVQAHGVRPADMKQSFHFHCQQGSNGFGKVLTIIGFYYYGRKLEGKELEEKMKQMKEKGINPNE